MKEKQKPKEDLSQEGKKPAAETGNASNPSPHNYSMEPVSNEQLLGKKAEKYLREGGNIEDMPDPQEMKNAEDVLKRNGEHD